MFGEPVQILDSEEEVMTKLKVTLKKSIIGSNEKQRATVKGLGLRRINHSATLNNTPAIRGMIKKVIHLIDVEEIDVAE
jgi:large subunit ribosomal protein L30